MGTVGVEPTACCSAIEQVPYQTLLREADTYLTAWKSIPIVGAKISFEAAIRFCSICRMVWAIEWILFVVAMNLADEVELCGLLLHCDVLLWVIRLLL